MTRNANNAQPYPKKITRSSRNTYQLIPFSVRKKLIDMVFEEGISVYFATKILKLRYSTAKAIGKKYQVEGVIYKPKGEVTSKVKLQNKSVAKKKDIVIKIEENVKIEENLNQRHQINPEKPKKSEISEKSKQVESTMLPQNSTMPQPYPIPTHRDHIFGINFVGLLSIIGRIDMIIVHLYPQLFFDHVLILNYMQMKKHKLLNFIKDQKTKMTNQTT